MAENVLLERLSENERQRLAPYLEKVKLELRENLLEAGESIRYVWFPEDAVTATLIESPEGTAIEVGLRGGEAMIGLSLLLGAATNNASVIVLVGGSAFRMRSDHFLTHVMQGGGELYELLLRYANAFLVMVAQTGACNALHTIDQRMARWILMTRDRVDRDKFPLTQEFLAYMLGVRRPSISIAASGLQQAGYIRYSRGVLTVTNRAGLEERACTCYRIIQTLMDGVMLAPHFGSVRSGRPNVTPS